MKKEYTSPEMEIRWFDTENICAVSAGDDEDPGFIPDTNKGDAFNW